MSYCDEQCPKVRKLKRDRKVDVYLKITVFWSDAVQFGRLGFAVSEQRLTSRVYITDAALCPVASIRVYRTVGSLFQENYSLSLQGFDDCYFIF